MGETTVTSAVEVTSQPDEEAGLLVRCYSLLLTFQWVAELWWWSHSDHILERQYRKYAYYAF